MSPPRYIQTVSQSKKIKSFLHMLKEKHVIWNFVKYLASDPTALPIVSALIVIAEALINVIVIRHVPYTEIDWMAYMQECEGFLNGTTNYALLRGDTGPLVYPAAFVYIYSALYYLTSYGRNVRLAQYIFYFIYLLQMCLVLRLYAKSRKVPPYVLVLSIFTSYRIHSIYMLRLFNDPVAILMLYASLNLFMDQLWTLGSVFFSLAVGVKMNILLFAPALLLFYLSNLGLLSTLLQLMVCAGIQLLIGAPFLLTHPLEYLRGSFNLGRIFEHKWTVNYRFLSKEFFELSEFHLCLLGLHVLLLLCFAKPTWTFFTSYKRLRRVQHQLQHQIDLENRKQNTQTKIKMTQNPVEDWDQEVFNTENGAAINTLRKPYDIYFEQCTQLALLPFFLCNLIGIACARSLHYQFYVWYFHTLPYLVWSTPYSLGVRFLILGVVEYCWNTYPSTQLSSLALHVCHLVLLVGVARQIKRTMHITKIKEQQEQQGSTKKNV